MHLPQEIRIRVDQAAARIPRSALQRAVTLLSSAYRDKLPTSRVPLAAEDMLVAYLVTRLPATYAAAHTVLQEVAGRLSDAPSSLLDLGAGCGAASLAAVNIFPTIGTPRLIEENAAMVAGGKEFLPGAHWQQASLKGMALPASDLVIASYTFGEMTATDRETLADRAWSAAIQVLVIIEAGSTQGFETMRAIRDRLLAKGAHMIAPCPHQGACPIPSGDWCHFAARVERSALHRQLKHATLSYEDEKYSYVALSKSPLVTSPARIIRRPVHQPGVVQLTVCHGDRIATLPVRKREKEAFRNARQASWGDSWARSSPLV